MTASKLMLDEHQKLISLREKLEQEITNRKRKMQISNTGNPNQWETLDDEIMEIEQVQRELQRLIVSFESTFEIQ